MFTLGRKIDLNYTTNKIIVIFTIVVAVLGWIITETFLSGISIAGGTFLAWALSREIDPNHEYSGLLSANFSLINILYYKKISLLVIFWILIILRMVNGITGKELTVFDIFSVLSLSIYLSFNNKNSIYLILFVIAMGILIVFKEKMRLSLLASGIAVGFFIVESFFLEYLSFNSIDYSNNINIIIMSIIFIFTAFSNFIVRDKIVDDVGNKAKKSKIIAGQIFYAVIIVLIFLFGDISLNNLIVYLSVIVGVIIYFAVYKVLSF